MKPATQRPWLTWPLLQPRQRLRDRLLAAMLVVALLPLVMFTLLTAVNLGTISRTTVEATHQSILEDQQLRLQTQVGDGATRIGDRLRPIGDGVRGLYEWLATALKQPPPAASPVFTEYKGLKYVTHADQNTSLVVGSPPQGAPVNAAARVTPLADSSGQLVALMQQLRSQLRSQLSDGVEAVWTADTASAAIRTVPALDVPGAVDAKRIDATAPQGRGQEKRLSLSRNRMNGPEGNGYGRPSRESTAGPFFTDPYVSPLTGRLAITVWSAGDSSVRAGADIAVAALTGFLIGDRAPDAASSYSLLVSNSNAVIASNNRAQADFGATPVVSAPLPLKAANPHFAADVTTAEQSGRAQIIEATLGGTDKFLFTAPIDAPQWVLISAVPRSDLEPDVTGLTRGIDAGIRRTLVEAIPVALVLVLLACLLSTLFARRMVGPVRALTTSAERLAEGHTDEPVPPQGDDEVGDLAASLERMRSEINTSREAILAASRELEQRVAVRTTELRARNEELVALNELAGSLTRSLDPAAILEGALDAVRAVLPVHAGRGYVIEDGGRLVTMTAEANPGEAADPELEEVAARALTEGRLVTRRDGPGLLIGLPMATRVGQLGALALRGPTQPGLEMTTLLMAIANQVGLALRTARLSAEGRDMAVLEERTRLAREIHDTLAQQLTGIVIQLEAAQALVDRDSHRAQDTLVTARDLARSALREARRSVWDLRPTPLTSTGVVAALEMEVERFRQRTGIAARMRAERMTPPPALEAQAEVTILRITQQALTNIADHSGATRVSVRLRLVGDGVELSIRDNGRGFEPGIERPGSFGIVGMAERARLAGGLMDVESSPGKGTDITLRLPVAAESMLMPA